MKLFKETEAFEVCFGPAGTEKNVAQGANRERVIGMVVMHNSPPAIGMTIDPTRAFGPAIEKAVSL